MEDRLFRVRKQTVGGKYDAYTVSIPREIGRVIPSDARFIPTLTEDGLLFRFVGEDGDERGLPHWITGDSYLD